MPWNDESGGSGGKGPWGSGEDRNGGSPWNRPGGNNNGGGRKGGSGFEEQMRKMQERFRGGRGGRGGSGGGRSFGPLGFLIAGIVAVLAWFSTGIVIVDEGEQAIVFRFGEYQTKFRPGFHVHWPYPIETHQTLRVEEQRQMQIGQTDDESLMLTQEQNIADVEFTVFWKIDSANPEDFVLRVRDPEALLKATSESVMREVIGNKELDPIITQERAAVQDLVEERVQSLMDDYQTGIFIIDVQVGKADAPDQVIDAFRDVKSAEQEAEAAINEAERLANQIVPAARGEAAEIVNRARGNAAAIVAEAEGQAEAFNALYDEYRRAPEVTRRRIFLETMEEVIGNSDKIIIDSESGTLPFLPLDRLGTTRQER